MEAKKVIVIAGVKIPQADWEQTPLSVRELIKALEPRMIKIENRLGLSLKKSL